MKILKYEVKDNTCITPCPTFPNKRVGRHHDCQVGCEHFKGILSFKKEVHCSGPVDPLDELFKEVSAFLNIPVKNLLGVAPLVKKDEKQFVEYYENLFNRCLMPPNTPNCRCSVISYDIEDLNRKREKWWKDKGQWLVKDNLADKPFQAAIKAVVDLAYIAGEEAAIASLKEEEKAPEEAKGEDNCTPSPAYPYPYICTTCTKEQTCKMKGNPKTGCLYHVKKSCSNCLAFGFPGACKGCVENSKWVAR